MTKILNKSQNIISDSKQRILKTASSLFSEFGFLGVSMEDIAKKLYISKAALYYHFKSKKELYLQVLDKSFQDLFKTINKKVAEAKSSNEIISQLIKSYLNFGLKEKNLIKSLILKTPDIDPEITTYVIKLRERINYQIQNVLKGVFNKNLIQKIDLKFVISSLLGIMDRLILETALSNKKLNVKRKTSQILQVVNHILKVELNK